MTGEGVVAAVAEALTNATHNVTEHAMEHEEHHIHSYMVLLFLFFALLLGLGSRHLLSNLPIPYTGLLLLWGLTFGYIDKKGHLDQLGDSLKYWRGMDPHLLLHIFIPALLFGSAFTMDLHLVRKCINQVLLLAGPGVLIATFMTAAICYWVLPYAWSFDTCLMVGSILSATDPVAVVALLKQVGASKRLGTIIEGESLLNDGTAYVLFLIFFERVITSAKGEEPPVGMAAVGPALEQFAQLALGGPLWGLLTALVTVHWLSKVFNDAEVEIGITLVSCYFTFFVAEVFLKASGVLAVVVLGVVMSGYGRTRISVEVEEKLHSFWEMIEYLANTIIFIFSGYLISYNVTGTDWTDWFWAFMLYVMLHVVRGAANLIMYPALREMGYGMDLRMLTMMTWGGLRGAVGLALALMVQLEETIDERVRHLIVFHVGIVATLTILINGTFTPNVLNVLGMNKSDPHKEKFFERALHDMEEYADTHCQALKRDELMGNPDWARVRELTMTGGNKHQSGFMAAASFLLGGRKVNKVVSKVSGMMSKIRSSKSSKGAPVVKSDEQQLAEMVVEMRTRFYQAVKAVYAEGFEKGYIDADSVTDLKDAADVACDRAATEPISDWDMLEKSIHRHFGRQKMLTAACGNGLVRAVPPLRTLLLEVLQRSVNRSVLLVTAYLYAHQEAQQEVTHMVDDGQDDTLTMEEQAAEKVVTESEMCCIRAESHSVDMKNEFPDALRTVKTLQVARTVLMHKERAVAHLKHRGLLEDKEVKRLEHMTQHRIKLLNDHTGVLEKRADYTADLRHAISIFTVLSKERYNLLVASKMTVKKFAKGTNLPEDPRTIGIVKSGIVEVFDSSYTEGGRLNKFGAGGFIGMMNYLVFKSDRLLYRASTEVELFVFAAAVLDDVMADNTAAWAKVWQVVGYSCARIMSQDIFGYWTHPSKLAAAMEEAEVLVLLDGERLVNEQGKGYVLVKGHLKREIVTEVASRLRWRRSARVAAFDKKYSGKDLTTAARGPFHGGASEGSFAAVAPLETSAVGGVGGEDPPPQAKLNHARGADIIAPYVMDNGVYMSICGAGAESLVLVLPNGFNSFGRSVGVMSKDRFTRRALLMGNPSAVTTPMAVLERLTTPTAKAEFLSGGNSRRRSLDGGSGGGGAAAWARAKSKARISTGSWGLAMSTNGARHDNDDVSFLGHDDDAEEGAVLAFNSAGGLVPIERRASQ